MPFSAQTFPIFAADSMDNLNLKKLAQELGLAVSTVSRALRDSHEISADTKQRVKELATKWGFQPNPHASSLRQSKSKTIAVIIPEIENNFFSQVMNSVEKVAEQKHYHVLIYLSHEDYNREKEILNILRNGRVDGVLISVANTTSSFDHLLAYREMGIPIVCFDRIPENLDLPRVTTDDTSAAFKATEHLVQKGAKRIAFLSMAANLSISTGRKAGYEQAVKKHQLTATTLECGADDDENRQLIGELINSPARPDAIFAAVEKLAINTYEVCKQAKIKIPEELKVIGFSNLSATALFNPGLSTIIQPAGEIGREATAVLFKLIEKKNLLAAERNIILKSSLIERESSGL